MLAIANAASPTFTELGQHLREAGVGGKEGLRLCQPREFAQAVASAPACPLQPLQVLGPSRTHARTHARTHSLKHSFTHSCTHALTHALTPLPFSPFYAAK